MTVQKLQALLRVIGPIQLEWNVEGVGGWYCIRQPCSIVGFSCLVLTIATATEVNMLKGLVAGTKIMHIILHQQYGGRKQENFHIWKIFSTYLFEIR